MRAILVAGSLALGSIVLSGCGGDKTEVPKTNTTYDKTRDGEPEIVGPGMKKGPKGGMMGKPGGGGATDK